MSADAARSAATRAVMTDDGAGHVAAGTDRNWTARSETEIRSVPRRFRSLPRGDLRSILTDARPRSKHRAGARKGPNGGLLLLSPLRRRTGIAEMKVPGQDDRRSSKVSLPFFSARTTSVEATPYPRRVLYHRCEDLRGGRAGGNGSISSGARPMFPRRPDGGDGGHGGGSGSNATSRRDLGAPVQSTSGPSAATTARVPTSRALAARTHGHPRRPREPRRLWLTAPGST